MQLSSLHLIPHYGLPKILNHPRQFMATSAQPPYILDRLGNLGLFRLLQRTLFIQNGLEWKMASTSIECPETTVTTQVSGEYQSFLEIFSKAKASGLPTHREFDCASICSSQLLHPGEEYTRSPESNIRPRRNTYGKPWNRNTLFPPRHLLPPAFSSSKRRTVVYNYVLIIEA